MSAVRLIAEASAAGLDLWSEGSRIRWRGSPSEDLLERLRSLRPEIGEILRGDRCRHCGERMAWPGPAGITFADGTAECQRCADAEVGRLLEAGRRAVASPDALADEAEAMLRGEPLP